MVQSYFPFDSGSGSNVMENMWSKMARLWANTGIIGDVLNKLEVYADSTGMQVKVKSGAAWMKGHYFESDAEELLGIATANATNPRIDRVIVRLDWTSNTIQLAILQGAPAASPVVPALTQNTSRWEISLAQVRVNAAVATITAGNITDERNFPGQILWSGDIILMGASTITPIVPLDQCLNGWALEWGNDTNGAYPKTTYVSKYCQRGVTLSDSMPTTSLAGDGQSVSKFFVINSLGTTITGIDSNGNGTNTVKHLNRIKAW